MKKKFFSTVLFLSIGVLLFAKLNILFQPVWLSWNNYNTFHDFYEQPRNTISTLFLGSSVGVNGFNPNRLYEQTGICSYNLSTEQQPLFASYYLALEAERLHPESLQTVVLDVSMLRRVPDAGFYRMALEPLRFSPVKLQAFKELHFTEENGFASLLPLYSYHARWSELNKTDFLASAGALESNGLRGHNDSSTFRWVYAEDFSFQNSDSRGLLWNRYDAALPAQLNKEAKSFLDKLCSFCDEKGITLILMKTPMQGWNLSWHDAVAQYAEEAELDFYDLNYSPYSEMIQYSMFFDAFDSAHPNEWGAIKITDFIASILIEKGTATDVRDNPSYSFLQNDLSAYRRNVLLPCELREEGDPCLYLEKAMQDPDNVLIISIKDEATNTMSAERREALRSLGLQKLSELQYRDSYIGVLQDHTVLFEISDSYDGEQTKKPVSYQFTLADGTECKILSGGWNQGNDSSCKIGNMEHSCKQRGLNVVIYNINRSEVVDSVNFDTYAHWCKTFTPGDQAALFFEGRYNYEDLSQEAKELCCKLMLLQDKTAFRDGGAEWKDLFSYLERFEPAPCYVILSVCADADYPYDAASAAFCLKHGLQKLYWLGDRESYIGILDEGAVVTELTSHEGEPLSYSLPHISVLSAGGEAGMSSVLIDGEECSLNAPGLNVVVINKDTWLPMGQWVFSAGDKLSVNAAAQEVTLP